MSFHGARGFILPLPGLAPASAGCKQEACTFYRRGMAELLHSRFCTKKSMWMPEGGGNETGWSMYRMEHSVTRCPPLPGMQILSKMFCLPQTKTPGAALHLFSVLHSRCEFPFVAVSSEHPLGRAVQTTSSTKDPAGVSVHSDHCSSWE